MARRSSTNLSMKKRDDHGSAADAFFDALQGGTAEVARELRVLVRKAIPTASESIKWRLPVYEQDGLICAIRPAKGCVALQFFASGTSLRDPEGLLEGSGKRARHVKLRSRADIKKRLFTAWIKQAAALTR